MIAARYVLFALIAAVLCGLGAAPAAAAPLVLRYEAYVLGVPVVSFDFQLDQAGPDYRIGGEIRTSGLLRLLYRFGMGTRSEGVLAAAGPEPRLHEQMSKARGQERTARLDFRADGSVATALVPPADPGRPRPTEQQIAHSMDPLTAILSLGYQVEKAGRCTARTAVYDGRRRYDIVLGEDGGPPPPAGSTGPVRRCAVTAIKLAGFSFDQDYSPHTNHGTAWLAPPVTGAPPLPLRIEFDSGWGAVTVKLVAVNPPQ